MIIAQTILVTPIVTAPTRTARICDNVAFLHNGRVTEHTSAAAFFERTASQAARNYLKGSCCCDPLPHTLHVWGTPLCAEPLTLQSTTGTQNSGLYDAILPIFTETTGISVNVGPLARDKR